MYSKVLFYLVASMENVYASGQHIFLIRLGDGIAEFVLVAAAVFDAVIHPAL